MPSSWYWALCAMSWNPLTPPWIMSVVDRFCTFDNACKAEREHVHWKSVKPIATKVAWWLHYGTHCRMHDNHPKRAHTCQQMPDMDGSNNYCWSCLNQWASNTHETMESNSHSGLRLAKTTWTQQGTLECIMTMPLTNILHYRQPMRKCWAVTISTSS